MPLFFGFIPVSLHTALKDNGGIKALISMASSTNVDVIAQVARGLANFAKCETREVIQGLWRSLHVINIYDPIIFVNFRN